jgi:hypothetical protein
LAQALPLAHAAPAQQAWPGAPHCTQALPPQTPPALHVLSGQQAAPRLPQLKKALLVVQPPMTRHARIAARMVTSAKLLRGPV